MEQTRNASRRAGAAQAPQVARRLRLGGDGSIVTLEDGEPCLEGSSDAGQWDWDAEAVSAVIRCQECGSSERIFKEPDGKILCETCLLRGPSGPRDATPRGP